MFLKTQRVRKANDSAIGTFEKQKKGIHPFSLEYNEPILMNSSRELVWTPRMVVDVCGLVILTIKDVKAQIVNRFTNLAEQDYIKRCSVQVACSFDW